MSNDLKEGKFNTDKPQANLNVYDEFFNNFKNEELALLELGVLKGGSLKLWSDYFPKGNIIGVDINQIDVDENEKRVKFYLGDQKDFSLLERITKDNAPGGFKVIIDDASHFGLETFESFTYLFKNCLKSGGIYVIEDWGTGYWPHYPDGRNFKPGEEHISKHLHSETDLRFKPQGRIFKDKRRFPSHDFGMVGVVKQFIDEIGSNEVTAREYTSATENLQSIIARMTVLPGIVFIHKK